MAITWEPLVRLISNLEKDADLLKAGGNAALMSLHAVLCSVWNTGIIPTDWKRGLVVPLWKGKGDRQDCNNYRGVTILSVPGKVFVR